LADLAGPNNTLNDNALTDTADMGDDYYKVAYSAGARVHSDSWGYDTPYYTQTTYEVDEFAAAYPLFLPMFAVGNAGNSSSVYPTYGAPANAKNILAIGATMSSSSSAPTYYSTLYSNQVYTVVIEGTDAAHWWGQDRVSVGYYVLVEWFKTRGHTLPHTTALNTIRLPPKSSA